MKILITGANRGLGLEFCKQYAAAGARVYACARSAAAGELAALLGQYPKQISYHALDVSDGIAIKNLTTELKDISLDVLLNNAGIYGGDRQSFGDIDDKAWLETLQVNTIAPMQMAEAFYPQLQRSQQPKIVSISSQMGALQHNGNGAIIYRSSKAALNKAMQTLAQDVARDGVIVTLLHPGWVKTDMGGAGADLSAAESITGLRQVIEKLTLKDSGKFYQWDGQEHIW